MLSPTTRAIRLPAAMRWAPLVGALVILVIAGCTQLLTTRGVARATDLVRHGTRADVDAALDGVRWIGPWCRAACIQPLHTAVWDRALSEILTGDLASGTRWLLRTPGCRPDCADRLVTEFMEGFPRDSERLTAAYHQLTGEDILDAVQRRAASMFD